MLIWRKNDLIEIICVTFSLFRHYIINRANIQSAQLCYVDILTQNIAFASFFIAITVRECYNSKRIIIFKEVYLWLLVIKNSGSF